MSPSQNQQRSEQFLNDHPDQVTRVEMNNMHGVLPGGYKRVPGNPFGLAYGPDATLTFREQGLGNDNFSELFLSQTPAEFFVIVDQAVTECGYDVAEVEKLSQLVDASDSPPPELVERIDTICIQVYRQLRAGGYLHKELSI